MNRPQDLQRAISVALEPFGELAFAILFGSGASGRLRDDSDVDVAVYGASGRHLQIETNRELADEGKIQLAVERETGRNVDLLVLNRAPAIVCASAVTTGIPVFVRDDSVFSRYRLAVTNVAIDFLETEREWRAIRARSASLSPLRNVMAHEYLDLRFSRIRTFIDSDVHIVRAVMTATRAWMESSGST